MKTLADWGPEEVAHSIAQVDANVGGYLVTARIAAGMPSASMRLAFSAVKDGKTIAEAAFELSEDVKTTEDKRTLAFGLIKLGQMLGEQGTKLMEQGEGPA